MLSHISGRSIAVGWAVTTRLTHDFLGDAVINSNAHLRVTVRISSELKTLGPNNGGITDTNKLSLT